VGFNQIRTRSGLDFETANKIAAISFNFFPNGDLRATHSNLLNVAGFRPVYSKLKDNFFAIDTEGRGLNAYSRYQAIPEGIVGFTLSWTQDDAQNVVLHGERLATLMSDLFRANIELGLPRSPPTPRPATAAVPPAASTPPSAPAIPDYSGNVVGVVEGKLNAIAVAIVTDDLAQNVNFAIKANVVTNFLDANNVAYTNGSLASTVLQTSEIAERAKSFTVMIECDK
jgi:hypothetical protein